MILFKTNFGHEPLLFNFMFAFSKHEIQFSDSIAVSKRFFNSELGVDSKDCLRSLAEHYGKGPGRAL